MSDLKTSRKFHPIIAREGWLFIAISFICALLAQFWTRLAWAWPFWIMNSVTNQKGQAQAKRVQNCAKSAHIKLMAIKSQPSRAMIGWNLREVFRSLIHSGLSCVARRYAV